ncbi:MAG: SURF1 family protein [Nocardioidaceae bacterium]
MRVLLTRRWLIFFVVVCVSAYAAWWLGEWQFHRLHDRKDRNAHARANLAMDPVPVTDVMSTEHPVARADEWSRVTITGTFQSADTIVVRYQTRDGTAGVDIVTPVKLDNGQGVLVDRGWMQTENTGDALDQAPPAASGKVTVEGWVRADGSGSSTQIEEHSVRAISSVAIGTTLDYPLLQGFVDAESQTPAATDDLTPADPPDLGNGPHFFYGLQWWFFGLLAIFGFCYLAYDEWRKTKRVTEPG